MKFTNKLIQKIGIDKVLHLLVGGWAVSSVSPYGWLPMLIMSVVIYILSVYKEARLDTVPDYRDVLFCEIGILIAWIAAVPTFL